jgi:amino acid transporter
MTYVDLSGDNYTCEESQLCGTGGFFPFGFQGVIKGASKCFYAFIGFDVIATTGEEVRNPKVTIPLSIIFTLFTVATCYISISFVASLMVPYYVYNADAPISFAFNYIGWTWASYVVSAGAIVSLATW